MRLKAKQGRKTLLTPTLKQRICSLLARGHTVKTTCGACGISERSYHEWRGKDAAFFARTLRARFAGRMRLVNSIMADKDWRARAWYLERCWPEDFARSEPRTIVIERPPPSASPEQAPRTTRYWTTTGNEIPFTGEQLAYIARLRSQYPPASPLKGNGEKYA
jgi:hypothetical protein